MSRRRTSLGQLVLLGSFALTGLGVLGLLVALLFPASGAAPAASSGSSGTSTSTSPATDGSDSASPVAPVNPVNPTAAPYSGDSLQDANVATVDEASGLLVVPVTTDPVVMGGVWARAAYTYQTSQLGTLDAWDTQMQRFTFPSTSFRGLAERGGFKQFSDRASFAAAATYFGTSVTKVNGYPLLKLWPAMSQTALTQSAQVEQTWVDGQIANYSVPGSELQRQAVKTGLDLHVVTVKLLVTQTSPAHAGSTEMQARTFETLWSSVIQCDPDSHICAGLEVIEPVN